MKTQARAISFSLTALFLATAPALASESAGDVGFPQLKQIETFPSQIFWLGVSLAVLYILMSRLALPRVASVIEDRESRRTQSLDQARDMSEDAEKTRRTFETALAKAQADARAALLSAEDMIASKSAADNAAFGETARRRLAQAEDSIAAAKAAAMASIPDIAADIAADMAGKIAGAAASKAEAKNIVTKLMAS